MCCMAIYDEFGGTHGTCSLSFLVGFEGSNDAM